MKEERDALDTLLHEEWKAPEPSASLDERVAAAYRAAVLPPARWKQFWTLQVSLPAPALVAAMLAVFALFFWLRPAARPVAPPADASGAVTQLNASGFQPLPNGEARIVPASEIVK